MKTKSVLPYFGSDASVARSLASMLDGCNHVTIPFCGGMSILPWLEARTVVANDLNQAAINFYRIASGIEGPRLQELLFDRCRETLSHPKEMQDAEFVMAHDPYVTSWIRAWAYWALCWIGRKGAGGTDNLGGEPSIRWTADGGNNASRIRAAAEDLTEWAEHFRRCEWLCKDFREVLSKVKDQDGCGIYCDRPFWKAGKAYVHSFTEQDHIDLRDALSRFQNATIVVRYDDCEQIRDLYKGWHIIDASVRDQCNAMKGEVWITNKESSNV